jgi:hypothetical protein
MQRRITQELYEREAQSIFFMRLDLRLEILQNLHGESYPIGI